ncbi:MAG: mechanosensitive ion channel, partial [Planctomycetes bacterium]|nr:mechanosensitive ion channel [Planctomycetota bacterium]
AGAAPADPANPAVTRKVCWCSLIAAAARRAGAFFLFCLGLGLAVCFVFPCLSDYARWLLPPLVCIAVMLVVYDLALAIEELAARGLEKMGVGRDATLLTLLRRVIRFVAVFWAILYLYERYSGSSLTTILAGLGIGGMAFAFAATDTIKNFIAFILILLDKPFVVGDHVAIGPNDGTVEYIGLRTTRIRASADGVPITLPNAQAVDTVMRNVSHQRCHHRADVIALAKEATPEQIRQALAAVKEVLNAQSGLVEGMPPQAYFILAAGAKQINYEYWFDNAAGDFAAFNERLSLALLDKIAAAGVPVA